jgi:hypothetical protein
MKKIQDLVEHMRSKPHHIRKRYAMGISGGITGVIALFWLVTSTTSGTFAINTPKAGTATIATETPSSAAAAAAEATFSAPEASAPSLDIVKSDAPAEATTSPKDQDPSVIPF